MQKGHFPSILNFVEAVLKSYKNIPEKFNVRYVLRIDIKFFYLGV